MRLDHLLSKEPSPHQRCTPELITRLQVLSSVLKERHASSSDVTRQRRPSRAASLRLQDHGPALLENCIASTSIFVLPSYKRPTVDALAPSTDEGRGWPRKATGSCRPSVDPWMSEWGNPAPVMGCHSRLNSIGRVEGTRGIETSQYPEEKKATATPLVAASEEGRA